MKAMEQALAIMNERFGKESELSLATLDGEQPAVRIVNSVYQDGSFYVITDQRSRKMKQICGFWFNASGIGENLGALKLKQNQAKRQWLETVFSAWLGNGHTDLDNPNTILLRIRLTQGVLMSHGTRYDLDFTQKENSVSIKKNSEVQ